MSSIRASDDPLPTLTSTNNARVAKKSSGYRIPPSAPSRDRSPGDQDENTSVHARKSAKSTSDNETSLSLPLPLPQFQNQRSRIKKSSTQHSATPQRLLNVATSLSGRQHVSETRTISSKSTGKGTRWIGLPQTSYPPQNFREGGLSANPKNSGETRRHSTTTTSTSSAIFPIKSNTLTPFWQEADDHHANDLGNNQQLDREERNLVKRLAMVSAGRRISPMQPSRQRSVERTDKFEPPDHPQVFLGRNMKLKAKGEADDEAGDSDSSMGMDELHLPQNRATRGFGVAPTIQLATKAARKREWPPPKLFDSDSEEEDSSTESEESETDEIDELESEVDDIEEIIAAARRSFSPNEIEILPGPPTLSDPTSSLAISNSPTENMLHALEPTALSSVRMLETKQLPFMLRNLRNGFLHRCQQLDMPMEDDPGPIHLSVRYEYDMGTDMAHIVETRLYDWICPLCNLHQSFPTQQVMENHLKWDHVEAPGKWHRKGYKTWLLKLTISSSSDKATINNALRAASSPPDTTQAAGVSSLFPLVTLSPGESPPNASAAPTRTDEVSMFSIESVKLLRSSPTPASTSRERSITATPATGPSLSSGRSTTAATTTTASATTTSTTITRTSQVNRYPVQPPQANPLGPAAQPPYLPAKSKYGGPDIHYSCRPGGPYLYDLIDTLPLEPFGVLAWDIVDREDEIYDSDDVKDEYKVMHALWGRWIVLNRNTFIKDYFKGTLAFVDYYWEMIHFAAGWDALRYWLLMLVSNRFITGSDVAKILRYYEEKTK